MWCLVCSSFWLGNMQPPRLVVQFRNAPIINLWDHILPDEKVAKTYNEREVAALKATQFFRVRTFRGSGRWIINDVSTIEECAQICVAFPRSIIYAAGFVNHDLRLANVPQKRSPGLVRALLEVGK